MNSVMNMVLTCTMRRTLKVMECIMICVRVEPWEIIPEWLKPHLYRVENMFETE